VSRDIKEIEIHTNPLIRPTQPEIVPISLWSTFGSLKLSFYFLWAEVFASHATTLDYGVQVRFGT
jgi:hypothetical protein